MTIQEALAQSGFTPEAIAALDAKALAAFGGMLTTAEQERAAAAEAMKKAEEEKALATATLEKAQLEQRTNKEWWETQVNPSLTTWEEQQRKANEEIANAKALAAFYETQNKAAREAGFVAADAPMFTPSAVTPAVPARGTDGKFVAGAPGGTPGSPSFTMEDFENRLGSGLDNGIWAIQEYQRLSGGQFLPDSVALLAQEANAQKLPFKDYVARKYDFNGKRAAIQLKAEEEKAAAIRAEAVAPYEQKLKEQAKELQEKFEAEKKTLFERSGNNPDVRRAAISNYPEVKKAVEEGKRKDPLSLTPAQRQLEMRRQIQEDIAKNEESRQGVAA